MDNWDRVILERNFDKLEKAIRETQNNNNNKKNRDMIIEEIEEQFKREEKTGPGDWAYEQMKNLSDDEKRKMKKMIKPDHWAYEYLTKWEAEKDREQENKKSYTTERQYDQLEKLIPNGKRETDIDNISGEKKREMTKSERIRRTIVAGGFTFLFFVIFIVCFVKSYLLTGMFFGLCAAIAGFSIPYKKK